MQAAELRRREVAAIREGVLKAVEAWEAHRPEAPPGREVFFCPTCTRLEEVSARRQGVPRCPAHRADMLPYYGYAELFHARRRELAGLLRRRLDSVLELFGKAAEASQIRWHFEDGGELVVGADSAEFRYSPALDRIEAFFSRYQPEADGVLEEGARRLGVRYYAEADQGPAPGYTFSRHKMLYVKEV
jgi:hypothetical protein